MGSRIGYFSDLHARSESPEGRADDFRKTVLSKLEEIGQIFKQEMVDLILFGGDLYDGPEPANALITDVQTILRSWNKGIVGVIGSHDYIGYQAKTLKRTALGIAESSGLINIVGGGGFPEYIEFEDFVITGTHHTFWFAEDNKNVYRERFCGNKFQIQLVHGDLNDSPPPWQHILIKNAITESDLVLSGHYHPGWKKPLRINFDNHHSVVFYNPGSVSRLARTPKIRMPKISIIDLEDGVGSIRDIELTAVENPFKEDTEVVSVESSMQDIESLLKLIASSKVETIDFKQVVHEVGKARNASPEVLDTAFEYIEKATNDIKN